LNGALVQAKRILPGDYLLQKRGILLAVVTPSAEALDAVPGSLAPRLSKPRVVGALLQAFCNGLGRADRETIRKAGTLRRPLR